ncbi:MAG TPA: N-acetyltransferase, partial [Bacteroidales bacterium]|nr:N-acetyltransferase [Bacteroidales bacterium]
MIEILQVNNKKLLKSFIDFQYDLYAKDPNFVPELYISQRDLLNPKKHPFHKHAKVQYFLAKKDDKIVGRLSAHINYSHNEFYGNKEGFFGFFDCINDQEVANALFKTAEDWLKKEGMDTIVGPANF